MPTKAEMGTSTLVLFIAMIIVAAIAAGILLVTTDTVSGEAVGTISHTKKELSVNLFVEEVSGYDGSDGYLDKIEQIVRLTAGSDEVRLKIDGTVVKIQTENASAVLQYKTNGVTKHGNNGYNTWMEQEFGQMANYQYLNAIAGGATVDNTHEEPVNHDLDGDGVNETVRVCQVATCGAGRDGTHLRFMLSSAGPIYAELRNDTGNLIDLSGPAVNKYVSISSGEIPGYGTFTTFGTPAFAYTLGSFDTIVMTTYNMMSQLNEDLDDDTLDDYIAVNSTHAIINLSSGAIINISLGVTLSGAVTLDVDEAIELHGTTYGHLTISGDTITSDIIPSEVQFRVTPQEYMRGYYVAEYLQESNKHLEGVITRGDIVKIHFETPGPLGEDKAVKILVIPQHGTVTLTEFLTPSVMATERIELFP